MLEPWPVLARREVFRNRWLRVTLDRVGLPNGQVYEYTTIHRDQVGVGAVVLNDQNQLLLEQEYRHPVGQVVYQLPGGLAGSDEDPVDCIRRELREETGLLAGELRYLGSFWNNPAISNGLSLLYLCRDVRPTEQTNRDPAEFIRWNWYEVAWVKQRVLDGTIKDRVVISALAFLWLAGIIS